jgi:hypothetical protein
VADSVSGLACVGCGKPLSRYNPDSRCQACVSSTRDKSNTRVSARKGDRQQLTVRRSGRHVRMRPPDYLPAEVLNRPDFIDACDERDLGALFRVAVKYGGVGFTVSHIARRCEMTVSQVSDYMYRARHVQDVDIFDRVSDGLHVPGDMLGIGSRPWEVEDAEPYMPTLLRALITERHWQKFKTFEIQFQRAAKEVAEREGDPDIAKLTISSRQWERWYSGNLKTEPHPDACRVLEQMFGYPVQQLLSPAGQDNQPRRTEVHSRRSERSGNFSYVHSVEKNAASHADDDDKALENRASDQALLTPWTVGGTLLSAHEVSEVTPVDRRSFIFLTGAALMSPAHEWLIARPIGDVSSSTGRTVEPGLVHHLDDITGRLRRMDDQMGGGSLIDVVRAQIGYVACLIREGRYTDSTGRRLHGSLGELLRLGGWVSCDDGNQAEAQRFWVAALHAAHTAGDSALGANVLGFMSDAARELGMHDDATKLAATALAGYKGRSPRVAAILHMRAALADAAKGDTAGCRRAIDSAYDAFRNAPPESGEPDWCYWMDEAMINEQIGTCHMWLDDYRLACDHLESSLRVEQNSQVREGALRLTRLASAYVGQGGPEQACEIGRRAIETLSSQVNSARVTSLILGLRDDLEPYRNVQAVQEFSESVNELAALSA